MPITNIAEFDQFLTICRDAFNDQQFQRLVLSKYKGEDVALKRITIRPILLKGERLLSFLYEYKTNHVTKNLSISNAIDFWQAALGTHFFNAHLITNEWEVPLSVSKKGKVLMKKHPNKNKVASQASHISHDRAKNRFVFAGVLK